MKKLFYTLIFLNLIALPLKASALSRADARCLADLEPPEVSIETSLGKLRYDFSKSNKSLTRMHVRNYGGTVSKGSEVRGLASYTLFKQVSFRIQKKTLSDGTICVAPEYVQLKIGVQDPTIYISRDLEKDSCDYIVAMRHEQTHLQTIAEIFQYYLPALKESFFNSVRQNRMVSSTQNVDTTQIQEEFKKIYFASLQPVLDKIRADVLEEQAKLDSPENYKYEQSLCMP